ncbi:Cyclic nucleotide-binding domain-containing protein [Rhizobium sp. RU20A]|uniref:cyclic nucleotide-binding domain-containing protein n=1 Tax=Rhizobium sp. RU20A TaxID=1907412 RepID=UPI000954C70B|nr:cyclic nucleotide-binding domain-containing protein [Rhizobium sp. RU20A]SIQ89245.1 Cyclic nucleotide-binding domain-containing protein [Rhizobium sp. RU20A]
MALADDIALLQGSPLFSGFDQDRLRLVAFGAEHQRVEAGEVLFVAGSPADCAYVVVRGTLSLSRTEHGRTDYIATVGRGTLLSELAMISAVRRKFTAIAETECDVMRIGRPLFQRLLEEYPDVGRVVEQRIKDNLARLVDGAAALAPRFS